jgi:PHD-zinc-finger like domain/PHD-finger
MNCVRPPLLKKPSRGFAWACAPCSRAQERKLEARRTPVIGNTTSEVDEEEPVEEEEDDIPPQTSAPTPEAEEDRPATDAEIAHAKLWTMRYLGIHCRVEDALQYDDRAIYPRASSRIGPRHQAVVPPWYGQAVELVKPIEIKRKFMKAPGHKKDTKLSKETQAAIDADRAAKSKRPKWIQDEPIGYVRRGEDHPNKDSQNTARLMFDLPEVGEVSERGKDDDKPLPPEVTVDAYVERAKKIAKQLGVMECSVDFLDRALYLFQENNFDADAAIKQLRKTDPVGKWPSNGEMRKDLRDPRFTLTSEEKKRFEDGVAKYGSELRLVRLHVKTVQVHGDIVRYWYYWKKTSRGHEIWGSFSGRRNAKRLKAENEAAAKLLDDIADKYDDSAFDNDKIESQSRKMICKHCSTRHSRVWRRAPGVTPGQTVSGDGKNGTKKENLSVALCERCARLWRRYAIKWENQEEMGKKVAPGGVRIWKKRVDEELLKEWESSARQSDYDSAELNDSNSAVQSGAEASKKRPRGTINEQGTQESQSRKKLASSSAVTSRPPSPPPPQPAMPKFRDWPCAICNSEDETNDELLKCRDCRLVVHRKCYGQLGIRNAGAKWSCDMCSNDRKESASVVGSSMDPASYDYKCVLCPVDLTPRELVETPRVSHKKKNDRERERERVEKEFAVQLSETYRLQQKNRGRPTLPREPLKRTADNNWAHVTCALFIPEIKFSSAKTLDAAEGVPFALRYRKADQCSVCKTNNGAAIQCHGVGCTKKFHVACALGAGYTFGFDVTPVKSTRRDSVNVVIIGQESGMMTAAIWCKDHVQPSKGIIHSLNESVEDGGLTALQLFAQNFKQADLTLTGTTRKANQLDDYTKLTMVSEHRRASTSATTKGRGARETSSERMEGKVKRCAICDIDSSPRWFKLGDQNFTPARRSNEDVLMTNGIKNEPNGSRESSTRTDGTRTNGISHLIDLPIHTESTAPLGITILDSVEKVPEQYVCNGCRWRRRRQPSESQKMDTDPLPIHSPEASPPTNRPVQQSWGPLANIPAQPPTHGTWPTSTHFSPPVHTSPQPFVGHPPAPYTSPVGHTPYGLPTGPPPPPPPPTRLTHHHVLPVLDALPANGHVPPPIHPVPTGLPNGISVHSPTHPHSSVMTLPRQPDGPYSAPRAQPPPGHVPPYGHHHPNPVPPTHHGSQIAPMAPGHPPPGPTMGPVGLPPQIPGSGIRAAHGASASPNVRNLIDG